MNLLRTIGKDLDQCNLKITKNRKRRSVAFGTTESPGTFEKSHRYLVGMPRKSKKEQAPSAFQKNFNEVLKSRGLTLKMASELAELPISTISGWTSGNSPSDLEAIGRFCQKLGVDFMWLCTGLKTSTDISQISLDELFSEQDTGFDGIYRLKATRLVRKPGGNK